MLKYILFFYCKKATELIEKSKLVHLNGIERYRLSVHISMCDACRTYQKISDIFDQKMTSQGKNDSESPKEMDKKKEDLIKKLNGR
jgi:hypothetical protein